MVDLENKPARKRLGDIRDPLIQAVVQGLYRFADENAALRKIEDFKRQFVMSKRFAAITDITNFDADNLPPPPEDPENVVDDPNAITLWVRGLDMTQDEEAAGGLGNFARIYITVGDDAVYTLTITKLNIPARYHPQRKREKQRHPDWGHPIMRNIRKQKMYATIEAAEHELNQLQMEYPDVCTPGKGKLFIMVYQKDGESDRPVRRHVLEIRAAHDGSFYVHAEAQKPLNKAPKRSVENPGETVKPDSDKGSKGYFSSMVMVKRRRKVPMGAGAAGANAAPAASVPDAADDNNSD